MPDQDDKDEKHLKVPPASRSMPPLPTGIPFLKHLSEPQKLEVANVIYEKFPDLIERIRQKIAKSETPSEDEYLGDEMAYFLKICGKFKLSFKPNEYVMSSGFSTLVLHEIKLLNN